MHPASSADLSGKTERGASNTPFPSPTTTTTTASPPREAGCLSSSPAEGSKLGGYLAETDLNLHRRAQHNPRRSPHIPSPTDSRWSGRQLLPLPAQHHPVHLARCLLLPPPLISATIYGPCDTLPKFYALPSRCSA